MNPRIRRILRNFLIELLIYGLLLTIYFLVVLRYLNEPLNQLFAQNLTVYAAAALILVILQSVALEWVTSFLVDRLGLEKLE